MANLLEDIQCAGSDTRPPMLDRTDFASWQQHIRLYCQGKENEVNILKSIDEGPFRMGTLRETQTEGTEGAPHLVQERPRVYSDPTPEEKERVDRIEDKGTMHGVQVQLVMREIRTELGRLIQVKQGRLSATTATENKVTLDEEQLLFIAGGQDNAVDEAPTAQTMFMENLSSVDPVYNKAGPSYDLAILSEVHDHDHYQDAVCEHHEVHEMHDDVQPNYVVDSHADYTSYSNMILYDLYVKDNVVPVVQGNVSSIPNYAYMMILNDMNKQPAQHVSVTIQNNVVDTSLTVELATYKEQVELYERRARFELTEREQKIHEQLKIVITDRNIKEENLKKELIRDLIDFDVMVSTYLCTSKIWLDTSSILNAACMKYFYLLKKGMMVRGKLRQLPSGEYQVRLQIANMDKLTVPLLV
nr:integrase, catalytic region, zinc finger, CCHC-type, peptidase aspartic, catalytic [Tanacetum cinerariifolium]